MFKNLIKDLSDRYHLIAPELSRFRKSEQPSTSALAYTSNIVMNTLATTLPTVLMLIIQVYLSNLPA
ncbi:hypothetical protein DYU05_00860 [Mucilaginibacter terrenus]|uniref:Uncharacterized protein n=1 Tax=Mucilaginibacter terrenus TaxID=2482727 RepID=A0A3E2NT74_9SPHI|nr:hypothetical protein DYU05_00860 [Mucilaginibacter terrenus]